METPRDDQVIAHQVKCFIKEYCRLYPVRATSLGVHRFDHLLTDYRAEGVAEKLHTLGRIAEALGGVDPLSLGPLARIDYHLLQGHIAQLEHQLGLSGRNPCLYVTEAVKGLWCLSSNDALDWRDRLDSLCSRMSRLQDFFEVACANLAHPPALGTTIAITQSESALAFIETLWQGMLPLVRVQRQRLSEACALARHAFATYRHRLIHEVLPRSTGSMAIGREAFEFLLSRVHFLDRSADALEEVGREAISAFADQIEAFTRTLSPGKHWTEVLKGIKARHPRPEELLPVYAREVERAKGFIQARDLVTIPRNTRLDVVPTPLHERHLTPTSAYIGPSPLQPSGQGWLLVTPVEEGWPVRQREERLREHSYAEITLSAIHEGYPGHHLQTLLAFHAPSPLMRLADSPLLCEGWALYGEDLMYEAGYYTDDVRLLCLVHRLWRARRLLLDIGLHTGGLSFERAVETLVREVHMERTAAIAEVQWYSLEPTVPLSYFIGWMEIRKLLDETRRTQGETFHLRRFHDTLLRLGALPPHLLSADLFSGAPHGTPSGTPRPGEHSDIIEAA